MSILPPLRDPFYHAVGLQIVGMIRRRFDASGRPGAVWPPPRSGGKPLLQGGRLQMSINSIVRRGPSGGAEISVGTTDKRAAILHFGGEIRPVKAKALFIPLSAKGRSVGPRPAGEREAARARILAADREGKLKQAARLVKRELVYGVDFILVGKVTIPARPFLFLAPEQKEELRRFVVYELRARGFGGN